MKFFIFKILKIIFRVLNIPQITKVKILNFELIRTKKFFKFQNIYNKNFNDYENRMISVAYKSSMMNSKRLWNILECSKDVLKNNIEGDFVECGVFKGGGIILMSSIVSKFKIKKKIWAYDTYAGMSKPDENDIDYSNEDAMMHWKAFKNNDFNSWCYASLNEVKNNVNSASKILDFNLENIIYVKGEVEKTLKDKNNIPEKISILRLDTDFYKSTKIELEILYPKLSIGGYLIIDDFGYWKGSKKACLEYFKDVAEFNEVDDSCVYLKKTKDF